MKKEWQKKQLGDVAVVGAGNSAPQDKALFKDGTIPFFRTADAGRIRFGDITESTDYLNEKGVKGLRRFPPGTILLPKSGASTFLNHRVLLGVEGCVSSHLATIVADESQVYPRFLLYFLSTITAQDLIQDHSYPSLNLPKIAEIKVNLPPLEEQKRIVAKLDQAFVGLAKAKENAEKNLQNARSLFESHLDSVFTQRGPGWKMEKLDVLTELARGHNPPKSKFIREQKPGYVRFYQIRDGGSDDYACYVPDTPQLHKMKKDDIMMVAYRHVGRAFRGVEGAFNVALCKISNARRDILDDDYLFHLIPSQYVKGELLKRSERSLIPSMSIEHLRELRIPLPPLREQQHIVKLINSLSKETQRLARIYEQKLEALESLKKSILHEAFSGEL